MAVTQVFNIAGSAMSAQSIRLNTIASNLANAESASSSVDTTYRARHPVFKVAAVSGVVDPFAPQQGGPEAAGVSVAGILESQAPLQPRYEPDHPMANEDGYVFYPNVNPVEEMANMISASRSYQSSVELMNTAKDLAQRVLSLAE